MDSYISASDSYVFVIAGADKHECSRRTRQRGKFIRISDKTDIYGVT